MLHGTVIGPQPFFSGIPPLQAVVAYCVQEKGELWRESKAGEGSGQGVSEDSRGLDLISWDLQ